jgi:hypothetical protein
VNFCPRPQRRTPGERPGGVLVTCAGNACKKLEFF